MRRLISSVTLLAAGIAVGLFIQRGIAQQPQNPGLRLNHVGIYAKDFDESMRFYTQTMGFREAFTIKDKDGNTFDGGKTYRLTVPANPPVKQYWSLTAYDRELHTLIKGMPRASRSSQIPELQRNADGSVDIYLGPKAPSGKESNWIPTDANRKFELMFRAYGPTEAFLQKTWVLPDVEKVQP